ncbi:MAG TPA: helix-turn-helix domain-containing protein [Xanthomonadales bacterium]|nr:helix-turn-helix domain-containing protein [Xanthomonadales bacterium]
MKKTNGKPSPEASAGSALILNSPVARAFAVVGDRWAGLIIRDAFLGIRQFEAFRKRSGAARGTLTSRLKSLVEHGILRRVRYQESPERFEYRLTRKGVDLYAYVMAVWDWETRWSVETHIPPDLVHTTCGQLTRPEFQCGECHLPVAMRDVEFKRQAKLGPPENVPARFQRRTPSNKLNTDGVDRAFFHVLDVIGDRWTGLVLAAMFFGLNRYDEITNALGIATNILSDRLKLLVGAEILEQVPYQERPVRYKYRLTEKGAAIYPVAVQMHEWAVRWLFQDEKPCIALTHLPCGSSLHTELVCNVCKKPMTAHNVEFNTSILEAP